MHTLLRQPADFPLRPDAPVSEKKKAYMVSLSEYLYPVLLDTDPEQMVEDEFKNRHNQLFCWRLLRLVSSVDQTTFSGSLKNPSVETGGQASRPSDVFEGNVEEQARMIL